MQTPLLTANQQLMISHPLGRSHTQSCCSHLQSTHTCALAYPPPRRRTEFRSKGKKKKKKSERPDFYALIGLVNERWTATDNQIKLGAPPISMTPAKLGKSHPTRRVAQVSACAWSLVHHSGSCSPTASCPPFRPAGYRKACLEHHPDKAGAAIADEKTKAAIEDNFKLIQEAYDTLSDPQRRREYDSVDDFDDSLPFDCAAADFFKVPDSAPLGSPLLALFKLSGRASSDSAP